MLDHHSCHSLGGALALLNADEAAASLPDFMDVVSQRILPPRKRSMK